jgi:hypothetical protein
MPAVTGIYNEVMSTTGVTSKLATYKFTSGSQKTPAVFTLDNAPGDAKGPFIIIRPVTGGRGGNFEDRSYIAGLSIVDVVLYAEKSRSNKEMRSIAHDLWRALHRSRPVLADYEMACFANYPSYLPDDEGFPGYVVSCEVYVRELKRSLS